jgi:hypothetical protein
MIKLKAKALVAFPIALTLLLISTVTHAYIPSRSILNDVYVSSDNIYVTDNKLNQWRLVPDCTLSVEKNDSIEVVVNHSVIKQGTPITIISNGETKRCKLVYYSKL